MTRDSRTVSTTFFGDGAQAVDLQDAGDLGEEALDEPEVTAGDAVDGGDGFGVGEVVGRKGEPEGAPSPSRAGRPPATGRFATRPPRRPIRRTRPGERVAGHR
jgi:hypothetical protein